MSGSTWLATWPLVITLLVAADAAASEEPPSIELLEFLGSWEGDDGQWVDPLDLLATLDEPDDDGKNEGTDNE
ncbi:MAG: hypothetical protein AMJ69_00475 [Gammaproteobacteria bacterium SG8_47]|nr:MAG: hypothetical protein AMJ69_00475 [Gammaproteobacteria bacterium SG8_47]